MTRDIFTSLAQPFIYQGEFKYFYVIRFTKYGITDLSEFCSSHYFGLGIILCIIMKSKFDIFVGYENEN